MKRETGAGVFADGAEFAGSDGTVSRISESGRWSWREEQGMLCTSAKFCRGMVEIRPSCRRPWAKVGTIQEAVYKPGIGRTRTEFCSEQLSEDSRACLISAGGRLGWSSRK